MVVDSDRRFVVIIPAVVETALGVVVVVVAFGLSAVAAPLVRVPVPLPTLWPLIRALLPCSRELRGETCSATLFALEPQRGGAAVRLSPETPYTTTNFALKFGGKLCGNFAGFFGLTEQS